MEKNFWRECAVQFFRFSDNYVILPVFYYCLIIICTCGQTAIFIKKRIEHKNDPIPPNQIDMNNQQWNNYICSNLYLIFLIISLITVLKAFRFISIIISNDSGLSEEDLIQLKSQSLQFILSVFVPLFMYVKNDKLLKHVKNEILDLVEWFWYPGPGNAWKTWKSTVNIWDEIWRNQTSNDSHEFILNCLLF